MEEKLQFAVLIDAENVSAKYAAVIFDELEKYGFASCRRIYGNWSKENGWKEDLLLGYSIIPIQQFSYTAGKNSTDIAMVIDAMDMLYQKNDPDNSENNMTSIQEVENAILLLLNESGEERLGLGFVGQRLGEKYPDFDVRNYGYSKLSVLLEEKMPHFKVIKMENQYYLKKAEKVSREKIERRVWQILEENNGVIDNLFVINDELKKRYSGFNLKDYGYSRISGFLRNMEGVLVDGNKIMLKNKTT